MLKKPATWIATLTAVGLGSLVWTAPASAAPVLCKTTSKNYMEIDSSQVSSCLDAGTGNLTGNPPPPPLPNPSTDPFLGGVGSMYSLVSKSDAVNTFNISYATTGTNTGTWQFDPSFWSTYQFGAIGFKFGTGNTADEWFVFDLVNGVSSGKWDITPVPFFSNRNCTAIGVPNNGCQERTLGLSHVNLYAYGDATQVPEPAGLALLGIGLLGAAGAARRKRAA